MNISLKSPLTKFILKALGFFVVWYIVYELWLLPDGSLDEWISHNIISNSNGIVQWLGYETFAYNRIIGIYGNSGIEVVDGCNGIAAMGLFLGFILAYPGSWKNRLSFSIIGICAIYIINLVRIVILTITQAEWPAFFDFTHDYSTTTIFYISIFLLWMIWVNFNELPKTQSA
ncbi:MAG: exosortase family protein XrtF [Balneola sp.]|jgi:exosortase family protein XrtF